MSRSEVEYEEHIKTRRVKPPATLYKYTTVEIARLILTSGKLRFQSPLRYNDPLDSQWDLLWPAFTPKARAFESSLIEAALRDPTAWPEDADPVGRQVMDKERARIESLPRDDRESAITDFVCECAATPNEYKLMASQLSDLRQRLRFLCLSETDRSILMWSHYAEQHRGVALGFDIAAMEEGFRRPFEPIRYGTCPPRFFDPEYWHRSMVFGTGWTWDWEAVGRHWALTKHTDWQYEREWRLMTIAAKGAQGDYDDIAFPRNSLAELVIGCRTDSAHAAKLRALAQELNANAQHFSMSIHPSRFELVQTAADNLPRGAS